MTQTLETMTVNDVLSIIFAELPVKRPFKNPHKIIARYALKHRDNIFRDLLKADPRYTASIELSTYEQTAMMGGALVYGSDDRFRTTIVMRAAAESALEVMSKGQRNYWEKIARELVPEIMIQ